MYTGKAIIRVDQPGRVNCERLVYLPTFVCFPPRFRFRRPKAPKVWRRILCKAKALKKSWNGRYELQLCQETHKVTRSTWESGKERMQIAATAHRICSSIAFYKTSSHVHLLHHTLKRPRARKRDGKKDALHDLHRLIPICIIPVNVCILG